MGRPIEWQGRGRDQAGGYKTLHCPLGRETALQRVEWTEDGWLRLAHGGNAPAWKIPAPTLARRAAPLPKRKADPETDTFDSRELSPHFNSLRVPVEESWLSLAARPGFLRLYGRESFNSLHDQSLIARRLQSLRAEVETVVEFVPTTFQQMAGLVVYYNTDNHAYLHISHDEEQGRVLGIWTTNRGHFDQDKEQVALGEAQRVGLKVSIDRNYLRFFYTVAKGVWHPIGKKLPLAFLSDENATHFIGKDLAVSFGFTGTFVGLACQDLSGARLAADFDSFTYRELAR